ncbi:MAG: amino acid ABC transporter permease [Candidatus Methylomirabilales bacterium]
MLYAIRSLPFLWQGLLLTLEVSALVVVFSLIAGVTLGVGIVYGPWWLYWPIRIYSDFLRGIPLLVLIFFLYYALPFVKINLTNIAAVVLALSAFEAAHIIEVVRGAIQSIPRGQNEAAKTIGLRFGQRLLYVIAPQAVRRFLPPWINAVVDTVKGSALVSLVGIVDLTLAIQQVIGRTYIPMPLYVLGAVMYFVINYCLSSASRTLEARFAYIRE